MPGAIPPCCKGKPDPELLGYLFAAGRAEATKWLGLHGHAVGKTDTAELAKRYLSPGLSSPPTDAVAPDRVDAMAVS
jgi:hypothetical protein